MMKTQEEQLTGVKSFPLMPDELQRIREGETLTIGIDGKEKVIMEKKLSLRIKEGEASKPKEQEIPPRYTPDPLSAHERESGQYDSPAEDEVLVPVEGGLMRLKIKNENASGSITDTAGNLLAPNFHRIKVNRIFDDQDPSKYYQIVQGFHGSTGSILHWDTEKQVFLEIGESYHELIIHPELGWRVRASLGISSWFIDPRTGTIINANNEMADVTNLRIKGDEIIGECKRYSPEINGVVRIAEVIGRVKDIPALKPISLRISDYQKKDEPVDESVHQLIDEPFSQTNDDLENRGGQPSVEIADTQLQALRRNKEVQIAPVGENEVVVVTSEGVKKLKVVPGEVGIRDGFHILDENGRIIEEFTDLKIIRNRDPNNPQRYYQVLASGSGTRSLVKWNGKQFEFTPAPHHVLTMRPDLGNRLIGERGTTQYFVDPSTGNPIPKTEEVHFNYYNHLWIEDGYLMGANSPEEARERKWSGSVIRIARLDEVPAVEPIIVPTSWEKKKKR